MGKNKFSLRSSHYLYFTLISLILVGLIFSLLLVSTKTAPLVALFFSINITGFFLMGYDKNAAHHNRSRVPELIILTIALLGGSPAILLAVHTFRHKTLKARFQLGLLLYFIIQLFIIRTLGISFRELIGM